MSPPPSANAFELVCKCTEIILYEGHKNCVCKETHQNKSRQNLIYMYNEAQFNWRKDKQSWEGRPERK